MRKEWFLLLIREIFSPVYGIEEITALPYSLKAFLNSIFILGMFSYIKESNVYWFTSSIANGMLAEYNLIGVVTSLHLSCLFIYSK